MIQAPMPTMRLAIRLARSPILIILSGVVCCDIFSSSASRGSVSTELIGKVPNLLECGFPFGKRCPGCDRVQAMPHPFSDVQGDRNSCGSSALSHLGCVVTQQLVAAYLDEQWWQSVQVRVERRGQWGARIAFTQITGPHFANECRCIDQIMLDVARVRDPASNPIGDGRKQDRACGQGVTG